MKRDSLNLFSFLAVVSLVTATAHGVWAEEDDVQNHPLFQPESSWEERLLEDVPVLENNASFNLKALEIIAGGDLQIPQDETKRRFSLGTMSDAVGGAITHVVKAPVTVVEKAVDTLSGLNPLNLLHNPENEEAESVETGAVDNSILTQPLVLRSKYVNHSYEEWFANETAESLIAQKSAPKEKRAKIQVLLQKFISPKD